MGANRLPLLVAPFTEYPGFPQMSTWGSPICGMRCEALSGSTAGDLFRVYLHLEPQVFPVLVRMLSLPALRMDLQQQAG